MSGSLDNTFVEKIEPKPYHQSLLEKPATKKVGLLQKKTAAVTILYSKTYIQTSPHTKCPLTSKPNIFLFDSKVAYVKISLLQKNILKRAPCSYLIFMIHLPCYYPPQLPKHSTRLSQSTYIFLPRFPILLQFFNAMIHFFGSIIILPSIQHFILQNLSSQHYILKVIENEWSEF